jgi:GTP-binding protein
MNGPAVTPGALLPTIVVVGSPNAGKSTLVNRLTGTRQAVVHETPGVTRDRKEVDLEWAGRALRLVDTGGYDTAPGAPFAGHVREQVELAIGAADVVLFVVDGRAGPLRDDFEIADVLRRAKVPVVLVANKLDDPAAVGADPGLYDLGLGEPLLVSAAHGLGTGELLDRLVAVSGATHADEIGRPEAAGVPGAGAAAAEIPVAIVGRPNAGKSSLFNAVVGEPRTIVSEIAGTTRDAIDTAVATPDGTFRFIDTAGMRKAAKVSGVEYYAYLRSVQSLRRAHVAVVVADATLPFGELDVSICAEAARAHCATVIAVNKSDLVAPDLDEIAGIARRKLRQKPQVVAVSARTHRGVHDVLALVASLEARYTAHIATRELNRALADLGDARPLPMKHGKRLKMYYISQFGTGPPRFAIEVNDRTLVTRDYGFFVENRLRARYGLDGVPVIIDFKGKK